MDRSECRPATPRGKGTYELEIARALAEVHHGRKPGGRSRHIRWRCLGPGDVAPTINADGSSGRSDADINPAVDADGPTLVYGDIPGGTVIGPTTEGAAPMTIGRGLCAAARDDRRYHGKQRRSGATRTDGDAEAAPGSVTGGSGTALLGPDGTYSVTELHPRTSPSATRPRWHPRRCMNQRR